MPKVREEFRDLVVKNTNQEIGDIMGHNICERKYFTIQNNDIIYSKLKKIGILHMPFLGPCVDYGDGNFCLEESFENNKEVFKVYNIDRQFKYNYEEFDNVEDAINKLVNFYVGYEIDSSDEMIDIFYETLNLKKNKKLVKSNIKK